MAPPLQRSRRLRHVARALGAAGDEEDGVATATSTRAGTRAGLNIQGRGYSAAKELTDLPEQDPSAVYGAQEKLAYQQFKEARAGKGMEQYTRLEGEYSRYLEDPYSEPPLPREPLSDEVEVLIIGAGFASLLMTARLHAAGFGDVRICEKGGDVGGTWYWNRYPGIACDVESYSYFPLLEEMDYIPTMKFASGFEIFEYCQKVAERYDIYSSALFHTTVQETRWMEDEGRWEVITDRGDAMRARFVIMANGILTQPKLAKIEGMDSFEGVSFHTSRWDYSHDLRGKKVGIIGTGATSVQAVPELAEVVDELYVFQRTPSSIDVRNQRETDVEQVAEWQKTPGWSLERRERFNTISGGRAALIGVRPATVGFRILTRLSDAHRCCQQDDDFLEGRSDEPDPRKRGVEKGPRLQLSPEELQEKLLETNFRIMEQIRERVDREVDDPVTAAALKPYYPYGCKRPCFHDEYLSSFVSTATVCPSSHQAILLRPLPRTEPRQRPPGRLRPRRCHSDQCGRAGRRRQRA